MFAGHTNLTVWYEQLDADEFIEDARSRVQRRLRDHVIAPAERSIAKARTRDSMHAFDKLTEIVDGQRADRRGPTVGRAVLGSRRAR